MADKHVPPGTNYKQVRVTFTEGPGRSYSIRVLLKPVGAEWHYRHTVIVDRLDADTDVRDLESLYHLLASYFADASLSERH